MKQRKSLEFINRKRDTTRFTAAQQKEVMKGVHSFNQRLTQLKKNTGLNFNRISEATVKRELQAGMTAGEFKNKYGQVMTDYYVKDGGIQAPKDLISGIEYEYRKRLGPNRFKMEGERVYNILVEAVEKAKKENVRGIPTEIISNISVESMIRDNDYNPYKIEKAAQLLRRIADNKSLNDIITEGKTLKRVQREDELRDLTKQLLKEADYPPEAIQEVEQAPYEAMLSTYKTLVGDKYKEVDSDYWSPGYFEIKDKKPEKEKLDFLNNTGAYRDYIMSELTETNYYLDNYFRALENQKDIRHARSIMKLLGYVQKTKLTKFLTLDDLKLEQWYRTDDESLNKSREQIIVGKIRDMFEEKITRERFFGDVSEKEYTKISGEISKLWEKVN